MTSTELDALIECRDNGAWAALCAVAHRDAQCYTDKLIAKEIGPESSVLQGKIQMLRSFFGLDNGKSALSHLIGEAIAEEKRRTEK